MLPVATITYSHGVGGSPNSATIASRSDRRAAIRRSPSSASEAASEKSGSDPDFSASDSSPAAIASATCCGVRPVSAQVAASGSARPSPSRGPSASTSTLGSGTPRSSTPSTPNSRATVRSMVTVVWRRAKSTTGAAMSSASANASSTRAVSSSSLIR